MGLYKQYRSQFDEIFFVVSNRGTKPETRVDSSLCQYDNVLCIDEEELQLADNGEIASSLTRKFGTKFQYFFGANSEFLSDESVAAAANRLEGMTQAAVALANQPYSVSDPKYGVHGGLKDEHVSGAFRGRLFYCGGAQMLLGQNKNFRYSTFGLFLAKSLFPDFDGTIEIQPGNKVLNTATPLTQDTLKAATAKDLLIMHSHQHCDVAIEEFPGYSLHVNAEYYDIHPVHLLNPNGELTLNYLPPEKK